MGTYRGNTDKVMADAAKIAGRLSKGKATIRQLQKQYHCGYQALMRAVFSQISPRRWKRIKYERLMSNGVKTRFQKGQDAWNKGIHFDAGGRSVETRFKPGHLNGKAARLWRPVGTITIRHDKPPEGLRNRKRKEGMPPWRGKRRRWIKVKDDGPLSRRWIPYARYLWQQEHGPVPTCYFVVHKDGDQMNDVIDNFVLVDHKKHLALQMKRDPEHIVKLRKAAGKAAKQRHETNRRIKQIYGPQRTSFLCRGCGADYKGRIPPQRCSKCGGGSFEKIRRRRAG